MDDGTGPRVRLMIAAAGTIIITGYVLFPSSLHGQTRRFMRRSNAPRRRSNNREQDEVHRRNSQIDGADDDSGRVLLEKAELTLAEEKFADEVPEGQRLAELVYEIAKDQAMQQGLVHHGVSCDACHTVPIRGVRFHCANCPDFDLCHFCEERHVHPRNHVFYKIRVPLSGRAIDMKPQKPFYTGRPDLMPTALSTGDENALLVHARGRQTENEVKISVNGIRGLYEQFSCIANMPWEDGPYGIKAAIDLETLVSCAFSTSTSTAHTIPSLVHERIFKYYDKDNNGLIGFEEYLDGTLDTRSSDHARKAQRIFSALDLDGDSYVTRRDFVLLFTAHFKLQSDIVQKGLVDRTEGEEVDRIKDGRTIQDYARGGRPLGSYFDYPTVGATMRAQVDARQGKTLDEFGDEKLNTNNVLADRQTEDDEVTANVARMLDALPTTVRPECAEAGAEISKTARTFALFTVAMDGLNELLDTVFHANGADRLSWAEFQAIFAENKVAGQRVDWLADWLNMLRF